MCIGLIDLLPEAGPLPAKTVYDVIKNGDVISGSSKLHKDIKENFKKQIYTYNSIKKSLLFELCFQLQNQNRAFQTSYDFEQKYVE